MSGKVQTAGELAARGGSQTENRAASTVVSTTQTLKYLRYNKVYTYDDVNIPNCSSLISFLLGSSTTTAQSEMGDSNTLSFEPVFQPPEGSTLGGYSMESPTQMGRADDNNAPGKQYFVKTIVALKRC